MVQEVKKRGGGIYPRGGWLIKAPEERKKMVYGYVKGMYQKEIQKKIDELIKPYR